MKVYTETEPVRDARKAQLMRIMAKHPHACLICAQKEGCTTVTCSTGVPKEERCCLRFGNCELERVAEYVGIRKDTPRYVPQNLPKIENEPLFLRDYNLCMGCTRCVRACQELRGVGALGFLCRNGEVLVGTVAPTLMDSSCRFCGACVEVCPTGALGDKGLMAAKREVDLVPCKYACPAEVDVPLYVRLICEGEFAEAAAVVREKLPLPNVLAHACARPCERVCRRREVNEPVSICGLKRFAMEHDDQTWKQRLAIAQTTGKKVAIIGSGPAGLSAAHYLRRLGHSATIFEALPELGGMMRYGIQEYRLPKETVERDTQEIVDLGVEIKTKAVSGEGLEIKALMKKGFDAVLVAIGLQASRKLKVEGEDLVGIVGGLDLLRDVRLGKITSLKGKVLVIGGGNVAMDVALTALRLGAREVQAVCLEKTEEMPAFPWEVQQALEEGVKIQNSLGVKKIIGEDGRVAAVEFMRCLSVFDREERFCPTFDENQTETIKTDMLILAIGQAPDLSYLMANQLQTTASGLVKVNKSTMETNLPCVFACGDVVKGPTSIVEALVSGRHAAFAIDRYFGGAGALKEKFVEAEAPNPWLGTAEKFAHKQRVQMSHLSVEKRSGNFFEVELGYDEKTAREEADRCLRCDLRLCILQAPQPPEKWLPLKEENMKVVPETEGVYQLLNENKEILYIRGTINLKGELEQQLTSNAKAKYFVCEEAKMYTMRESEMLQQYAKRHGKMPEQNMGIEEDLY